MRQIAIEDGDQFKIGKDKIVQGALDWKDGQGAGIGCTIRSSESARGTAP